MVWMGCPVELIIATLYFPGDSLVETEMETVSLGLRTFFEIRITATSGVGVAEHTAQTEPEPAVHKNKDIIAVKPIFTAYLATKVLLSAV